MYGIPAYLDNEYPDFFAPWVGDKEVLSLEILPIPKDNYGKARPS